VIDELGNDHPALRRCYHPVARSHEVAAKPVRRVVLGSPWVLWRDENGRLCAFEDRCPHRQAPLSLGACEAGTLRCGYHGWRFDAAGRCVEIPALGKDATIPAKAKLRAPAGLVESHSIVYLAPDEPLAPIPSIVEDDDDSFMRGDLPIVTTRGCAGILADNFLDMAHFPFVHAGTFGAGEAREVDPYDVTREGLATMVSFEHEFANREDPAVAAGTRPLLQRRRLTYRYTAPFHLALRIDFLDAGGTNTIGFFLCPESKETTRVYSTLWRNDLDGDEGRMAEAVDFEMQVVAEDLALSSRFDALALPLDVTVEVHSRADKTTLELRRVLAELVETAR